MHSRPARSPSHSLACAWRAAVIASSLARHMSASIGMRAPTALPAEDAAWPRRARAAMPCVMTAYLKKNTLMQASQSQGRGGVVGGVWGSLGREVPGASQASASPASDALCMVMRQAWGAAAQYHCTRAASVGTPLPWWSNPIRPCRRTPFTMLPPCSARGM